jgi:hypothetical protein
MISAGDGANIVTASQKLKRVKILQKLFGQLGKFQVNDLTYVFTWDET